jgi:hypothetical protein
METAWLDLADQRARIERTVRGVLNDITVLGDGIQVSYNRDLNSLSEQYLPSLKQLALPASLQNPALFGAGPLAAALWQDKWKAMGQGEWQGKPATRWQADLPATDDFIPLRITIYLEPATWLPLGMESRPAKEERDLPEILSVVSFGVAFVPQESVPHGLFAVSPLRDMQANYGGKLEGAKTVGLTILWLEREVRLGKLYPSMTLSNVGVNTRQDVNGPIVSFFYQSEQAGYLHIVASPRGRFEASAASLYNLAAWWIHPTVVRRPTMIDGIQAEYATGHRLPPPPPSRAGLTVSPPQPTYTELLIWLPDSVVRVTAPPMLSSLGVAPPEPSPTPPQNPGVPPPAAPGAPVPPPFSVLSPGPPAPPPPTGVPEYTDKNRFNNEEALRHLLDYLKVLR